MPIDCVALCKGSVDAPMQMVKMVLDKCDVAGDFRLRNYDEHALNSGSSYKAAAYIEIEHPDGTIKWGVAVDTDIIIASVKAVLSSLNR